MKTFYTFLIWTTGLTILSFPSRAQLIIEADAVVASSTDFVQANVLVDGDRSNYTYLSANLGILSTSSLTVTFPQSGHAGDIISFDIQESGELLSLLTLSTSLLNNVTIKVYNDANALVATGTGNSLLDLDLSLNGPNVYTLRYMTDATANYKIKKVTLELNSLLTLNTFKEFRIYNARLQTPCPAVYATGIVSFSNLGPLGPSVSNSNNAVSASTTDFATMNAPILSNPSLDLSFSTKGIAGEYVGVTINQSGTILSLSLLQSLILEAYNTSGTVVATSPNFALADLRLIDGTTDKYYLGFVTPAGTYDIAHLKLTFGGLNLFASLNVYNGMHFKLQPAPVSITATGSTFCDGSTLSLTANAPSLSNIVWNTGATANPLVASSSSTYSFTATDVQGCVSTSSPISLTKLPLPTLSITNGATAGFCAGKTVTLSSTPSAGATVVWNTGESANNITVSTAGTYTATATGINLCASLPASVTVASLPLPTLSITNGATAGFCAGKTVTLSSTPSAGATVVWNTGESANNITVSTAGTYTATATGTNLCASLPASVTVASLPLPTLSITNGATAGFCAGKTVTLSSTPSAGATVVWNTGESANNITVSTAGTYTATATGTNLCASLPASVTVASLPLPTLSITNGATAGFCAGKTVTLFSTPSAGATVVWNTGESANNITVSTAGTYTATATGINLCASLPASVTVASLPLPTLSITNGATAGFCGGKTVTLSSTPSAGATVVWNTGESANNITVSAAGTYTATATGTNLCASLPASVTVASLPLPTLSITNGATAGFCAGKTVTLSSTPSAGATVVWNTGESANNIMVSTAGTYTATATGTNLCASLPASVTVASLPLPTLSVIADGPTDFCPGQHLKITATTSSGSTLLWNTGETASEITIENAGDYTITATNTDGCEAVGVPIHVTHKSIPEITVATNNITCNGLTNGSIAITPKSSTASYEYTWNNGEATASIANLTKGQYDVTVKDMNSLCSIDFNYSILEPSPLSANIMVSHETCAGNDGQLNFTIIGGIAPYTFNISTVQNNILSGLAAGTYSFVISDANMCTQNISETITPANCATALNIHNVVTPNNDGLNDVMMIDGIENFPNTSLEIFDKWGDVVFNSKDYHNNWNGRNKNDSGPLPAGTYYYLLKLSTASVPNGDSEYTGYVMIQ